MTRFAVNGKCAGNVRSASSLTTRNCKIGGSDLPIGDTTAWSIPEKGRGLQRYASLVRPTEAFNTPPGYICLHGAPKDYYSVCGDEESESLSKPVAPDGWCVFDSIDQRPHVGPAMIEDVAAMPETEATWKSTGQGRRLVSNGLRGSAFNDLGF